MTQQYQALQGTFFYWNIQRSSAQFQPFVWSETSHLKHSTTVEPVFLRREAAWVCPYLQKQGPHQNQSLTGPALALICSACYCVGGGDYVWVYPSTQLLWWWSCPQVGLYIGHYFS
jgi:hypothetical protein